MRKIPLTTSVAVCTLIAVMCIRAAITCSQSLSGLQSEVRTLNGTPALYVNGKLTSQVLAAPYRPGPSDFGDFSKAGISIFDIYLNFDWTAPEVYDFQKVDAKMDEYLKLKPDALFLPRV